MYCAKIAHKLREQMVLVSGELSTGLPKVVRRFVAEMTFGIQARGSVRLTEVGRARGEPISLKKTEGRLSRRLGRRGLEREIQRRLIEPAAPRIEDDTLLVMDLSDVTKKYAEKMENPCRVRDGSEKKSVWHVVQSYITRWRIEDVIRFVKQSYQLEDMCCLAYRRLQALMALVTAAAYFAAVYPGLRMKLRVLASHVLRASKRVFGIPDFRLYALADGIRQLLYSQTRGLKGFFELQDQLPIQPNLFNS